MSSARDQFRQYHGDGLQGFRLALDVTALALVLHHKHAQDPPAAQYRHAKQRLKYPLTRLRAIGELWMGLRVFQRQRARIGGDIADQTLADPQAGSVDGILA